MNDFRTKRPNQYRIDANGLTAEIFLTQGKVCVVDIADLPAVLQYRWYAEPNIASYYASTNIPTTGRRSRKTVRMHSFLVPSDADVDHVNHDGLDNRRSNLRACSRSQNMGNKRKPRKNPRNEMPSSQFKGVVWRKKDGCWQSQIKGKYIGQFTSEADAAQAYNFAAYQVFGEFAELNAAPQTWEGADQHV